MPLDPTSGENAAPGSESIIIQAENVMLQAAQQAKNEERDPSSMLRVLALLAAPVLDPKDPGQPPIPLDLHQEWHVLAHEVRQSNAPILLARLQPPTLQALRSALSPRAGMQELFPHILHFSGHAWREGLLLEDDLGQVHPASTGEILDALNGLPQPLDLVVLNGCESAADARSVAQALLDGGRARAVVGHERPVLDSEAVAFAGRLYAELTGGFPLKDAVDQARRKVTTHEVMLLGDDGLRFEMLNRGEPVIDRRRAAASLLSAQIGPFLGRGSDLVQISGILSHPPAVVVLFGPPGIGKTSLILQAALRNQWRFPGGVAYACGPRSGSGTATEMLRDLAGGLGLSPPAGREEEVLRIHTASHPTLMLLDNLESLPQEEMEQLSDSLRHLGGESAALLALRPSSQTLEDLPLARSISLHHGLAGAEAERYALYLARQKGIPLDGADARLIACSVDGHPLLIEKIVAQARRGDLKDLLDDVMRRQGDFAAQIGRVYKWCQDRLDDERRDAWASLPLFPAGAAPETLLKAAAGKGGPQALREAALADFDPEGQAWRWHATVAEYASSHWPIPPKERQKRLLALAPAWTLWLERLSGGEKSISRIEDQHLNLDLMVQASAGGCQECRPFLEALREKLPPPDRTLILRELIARLCQARLEGLEPGEEEERARRLNDLGIALSALGRREDALASAQEAVEIHRKLARSNPAAFLPDLATSLNNLGNRLSALGRQKEAMASAQEAVDIHRHLAQSNPSAFLPDLATSLNNLGAFLSALGRREDALVPAQQAVEILRKLAQSNPAAFLPDLATSLNNLGIFLSALGRREDALALTQEAVDILRKLAQSNPSAFLPDLAMSLNNLGTFLSALGRRKDALALTQEAVDIRRKLAQSNPAAFLPDLARSLNSLGNRLSALGRLEEALAPTQEAVEIRRKFAQSNLAAFLPDLATSLNNLGASLSDLGRWEDALAPAQEATEILRRLAHSNPAAFLPHLATSLNNLGAFLSALGRREDALAPVQESVDIHRQLARSNPAAFLPDLAGSLNNLGASLSDLGRREDALAFAQEAVDIRRKLAQPNPAAFLPGLAKSLGAFGSVLSSLEQHEKATGIFAEGLQHIAPFYQEHPDAFAPLAGSLQDSYLQSCREADIKPDEKLLIMRKK
jgi:predicted O-linked N-acetylglucosamine transferase (SPINDLY family)